MDTLPTTTAGWVMLIGTFILGIIVRQFGPKVLPNTPPAPPVTPSPVPVPAPSPFPPLPTTVGNGEILAWLGKIAPLLLPIILPLVLEKIKDGTLKIEVANPPEDGPQT